MRLIIVTMVTYLLQLPLKHTDITDAPQVTSCLLSHCYDQHTTTASAKTCVFQSETESEERERKGENKE